MRCHYCNRETVTTDQRSLVFRTKDHKTARSRGGRGAANMVVACRRCNGAKATADYEAFYEFATIMLRVVFPGAHVREARRMFIAWEASRLFAEREQ